jgi:hypothetical protein
MAELNYFERATIFYQIDPLDRIRISSIDPTFRQIDQECQQDEKGHISSMTTTMQMATCCQFGWFSSIHKLLSRNSFVDWNKVLKYACYGGFIETVRLAILRGGRYWYLGLTSASKGHHFEVAKLMLSKLNHKDPGTELQCACHGGYRPIVDLLIAQGAKDWSKGLRGACVGGHVELAKLMISRGANDWNRGLREACYAGYVELAKLMISHGANNWQDSFQNACHARSCECIELIILASLGHGIDFQKGLDVACHCGNYMSAEFMFQYLQKIKFNQYDWNFILMHACAGMDKEVVELVISRGQAQGFQFDWSRTLNFANTIDGDCDAIKQLLRSKVATDDNMT